MGQIEIFEEKSIKTIKRIGLKGLLAVLVLGSAKNYAQATGVGTKSPQATLDITGNPGLATAMDGMIPPRITGAQLRSKTYTSAQRGAIVFVTAPDSAPSGQTIMVTAMGHYIFNGTIWKKISRKLSYGAASDFILYSAESVINLNQIAVTSSNQNGNINNIDLGLKKTVIIPPKTTAKILVNYNIPIMSRAAIFRGFIGINFKKNDVEMTAGSRRYTFINGVYFGQSTFFSGVGKFAETVVNTANSPLVITYSATAFTEKIRGSITFNSMSLENIVGGSVMDVAVYLDLDN
ncbi:hypothetical protein JET18_15810 [Chryseobacterium sp. L7]|uniref:Uncharacterized protein n=1 Tax=Chryseobacterium endalhagicum TaxID=2797638 RepID=A0ABS1QIZ4_9FLAO|nr:hypothetical protein [Chryseobacterium endalhagicum]MBL1222317.1 hypothetical protein [Chryseobacterium endalhagicum]